VYLLLSEIINMGTKAVTFRLEEEIIRQIEELAQSKGISKTEVVRLGISKLLEEKEINTNAIRIIQEQNKQLQMALSTLNKIAEEKERIIREKDERIKDLQKIIDVLQTQYNNRNRSWWQFWKK